MRGWKRKDVCEEARVDGRDGDNEGWMGNIRGALERLVGFRIGGKQEDDHVDDCFRI